MTFHYKRGFGRKKKTTPTPPPGCQFCGAGTVCTVPVFLRLASQNVTTVCHKNICLSCGKIQCFTEIDAEGNKKRTYAFWSHFGRKCRDFSLPRTLFETPEGKADVGVKVRFIRALLRVQISRPTENCFTVEEVQDELNQNDPGQ